MLTLAAVFAVIAAGFRAMFGARGASSTSPNPIPTSGPVLEPATPVTVSAEHAAAHVRFRPMATEAAAKALGRTPQLWEIQYFQAIIGGLESFYGGGWKGAMIGSFNMGAEQCSTAEQADPPAAAEQGPDIAEMNAAVQAANEQAARLAQTASEGISHRIARLGAVLGAVKDYSCVSYQDSNPDGSSYGVKFKFFTSAQAGVDSAARSVLQRKQVAGALASGGASIFRASFAMRRTKYYGGFCPHATAQYGADAAKASFGQPDRDAGTLACQAECVTAHAATVARIVAEIATACGDSQRLALGTLDDATTWYHQANG